MSPGRIVPSFCETVVVPLLPVIATASSGWQSLCPSSSSVTTADGAADALWFQGYGLVGCTLDSDALRNGTVSLVHASGIFPDGTPFHMPQSDAVPAVRQIADVFPPTRDTLTIFLGIRERKSGGRNCAVSGDPGDARYFAELRSFNDETSGEDIAADGIENNRVHRVPEV